MSDAAPAPGEAQAGVANLRETAKWTVGGLAAVAAAVIAGSPLTGLGALDPGWRLTLAVAGAAVGFAALGFVVWTSIDVMIARVLTFQGLVDETILPAARQHRLEKQLAVLLPPGLAGFKAIGEQRAQLQRDHDAAAPAARGAIAQRLETLREQAERLFTAFDFAEIRDRFLVLRRRLFGCAIVIILGFGTFAWAANPGKEAEPPLAAPYVISLAPRAENLALLRGTLADACLQPPLRIVILRERASGALEGVLTAPSCPPARVVLRDKGTTIALQR